jgi:hypothetical protein
MTAKEMHDVATQALALLQTLREGDAVEAALQGGDRFMNGMAAANTMRDIQAAHAAVAMLADSLSRLASRAGA